MRKTVTRAAVGVTKSKERPDMKWIHVLTMWAGLVVVAFLLATMYSMNLPRIIP
jgi:hypothetical protein